MVPQAEHRKIQKESERYSILPELKCSNVLPQAKQHVRARQRHELDLKVKSILEELLPLPSWKEGVRRRDIAISLVMLGFRKRRALMHLGVM